ncbi:phosphate ABC transporter permease [Cellulosimicrobium sp. TH-20]|uniref:ABC transporter permease n=1 Tax=Cellulosimicrobium sp. TH-20 TaxID=1980001 RepID=UPI000A17BF61|nr:ABC transporter permease [Cellulosimicrobium sp. TH-20]ARK04623.1 phosphate ABC transporter permease [Cellulosimicrobium sp. TH-20]
MTGETSTTENRSPRGDLYSMLFAGPPSTTEVVSAGRLTRVGARPPLGVYLGQLWNRRHFLWAEARAKVTSGTRENLLGTVWLVLKPVLDGLTYFLIFGLLLKSSRGIDNFIGYLIVGVFLFSFTTKAVTGGANSIRNGRNLIRAFSFPRASLPISVILRGMLDMIPVLGAMVVLLAVMPPAEVFTWRVVLVPGVLALQVLFTTGLALLLARCVAVVPDLNQLISFGMRLWLYGSAVFFSYDQFIDHPTALALMEANPMFMVLSMVRDCLLYGVTPALSSWLGLGAWAVGTLVVGFLFFYHGEESYGRA